MVDSNRLKAQIFLRGKSTADVCAALKMTQNTWYGRINGRTSFTLDDIVKLVRLLQMSQTDIINIFFANDVS